MQRVWVAGELTEDGNWRILGLFSTAEKAVKAIPPRPAGFIFPYPLDIGASFSGPPAEPTLPS